MVKTFFSANESPSNIGDAGAYLGSVFFLGYIPGCYVFAFLADKFGRRPVLLLAIFGNTVCLILFGFSLNFAWALTSRFACGAFGGVLSVARTYNAEITDDSNRTIGFATIGSMSIMGRTTGLVIGGFLSEPVSKYHQLSPVTIFHRLKFLLPCLVGSFFGLFNFMCGCFFLKETLKRKYARKSFQSSIDEKEEEDSTTMKKTLLLSCIKDKIKKLLMMLRPIFQTKTIVSMMLFGTTPFALLPSTELKSLLLVFNWIREGVELEDSLLGIIIISTSVATTITQVVLYYWITKYIGYLWTFRLTSLFLAGFLLAVPFSSKLMGPLTVVFQNETSTGNLSESSQLYADKSENQDSSRKMCWVWLAVGALESVQTLLRILYTTGTPAIFGSATTAESRSFINGIGQSLFGTSSLAVAFISGPLHRWSTSNGLPWFLNYYFPFELVAMFILTAGTISFLLPTSVSDYGGRKKVSESEPAHSPPIENSIESGSFLRSVQSESDNSDVG